MANLELRSIRKMFGDVRVLDDITIRVPDGSFTILLGSSGCGKSTLLRTIAGLELQTSGHVVIDGRIVDDLPPRDRDIAMVFQQYALYPHLSVRENMAFGLRMHGTPQNEIEARTADAARLLGIEPLLDRKPKALSGGQRQRVAMGRAIVRKPKLFLFDEPLSNLDAQLRSAMRLELKRLHERLKATMIYVTHDQVEAMTLGDTIALLDRGHLRQCDTPQRLYREPADPFVAGFLGTPPMNLWKGTVAHETGRWHFRSDSLDLTLPPLNGTDTTSQVPATFGIRPEHVLLERPPTDSLALDAEPEVVEDLGSDVVIHCLVRGHRLVVRLSPGQNVEVGRRVPVFLPHDKLHLFIDHRRVGWA
ncbi:sugar ABC transporter ATP-binding protein [Nitrospira sp.]|nr:sugar ABC transporter ATP-binding protein [Nitrospira sp.]